MIKLIAIDLDGTLLNSDKAIPEENKQAVSKAIEAGIAVVICTGRPLSGAKAAAEELGLVGEEGFVIVNNGCSIYRTRDWSLLDCEKLTKQNLENLKRMSQDFDKVHLAINSSSGYGDYEDVIPDVIARDAALVATEPSLVTAESLFNQEEIVFKAAFMGVESALNAFQERYHHQLSKDFSVARSQVHIYDVMPLGTTKASGLKKVMATMGLSRNTVMAIGDALNDLEMLAYVEHSVAMENAKDQVKAICRYQTSSNDDAGVGQAIRNIALTMKS